MILISLVAPLSAFAPTDEVYVGVEPARVSRTHVSVQNRLRRSPAWAAFAAGEGAGWQVRFDERTGQVRRATGPGIDLGRVADRAGVEAAVRGVLARHPALVGVALDQLALRSATYVARLDTWYVTFDRLVDGVPVWRGGVTARVVGGKLVMLGLDTHPGLAGVPDPAIGEDEALRIARVEGPAPRAVHLDTSAELVVLPEATGYRLCWLARSRTQSPPGIWVSFVDAVTGELVNVHNEVRFLAGTLSGRHDTRTVDGSMSVSPIPLASLTGSDGTVAATLDDGTFDIDPALTWTTRLRGSWLTVRNSAGDNGELTLDGSAPVWTDGEATQAEIDSYVFLHQVRDWAVQFAPEVGIVDDPMRSNVNLDSSCNAYYDGSVNFYEEGDGCANTGRIGDVNYHEWGHGFHYYSVQAGTVDGTMGEGVGDVVSMLQTLDSDIAPYFYSNGSPIRELASDRVYPDDVIGEVHEDGLIYGGAMWDLYQALLDRYGEDGRSKERAWEVTSQLLADSLKGGPTLDTIYDEMVIADESAYGGDHLCEIVEAFGAHGLGPGGTSGLLSIDHEGAGNQRAGAEPALSGALVNLAPECSDFSLGTVDAVYSTDGGETWDTAPLDVSGDDFEGVLPPFESGTIVTYYLVAQATDGTEVASPAGEDIAPHTFYVGELEELYCEDFEDDDGDYTHELLDGRDQRGADDWIWGEPQGMGGDPAEAFSGARIWGNDLGGGEYNGEYQPEIVNRLTSPDIDVGEGGTLIVQFRRWLQVEDAEYDVASVYANEEAVWSNHESRAGDEHTEDGVWMLHTMAVEVDGSTLSLGWEIDSDEGLEFGGWNVDDVCVYRPVASEEPDPPALDDTGDPSDPDRPGNSGDDEGVKLDGGCGCDGGAGAGSLAGVGLALAGLLRLRRRG
ncbi:MAG: M36 family metallopeptidase [Myxococcota bacterium]